MPTDYRSGRSEGLFPPVFNLGNHASIDANATCGVNKQENKIIQEIKKEIAVNTLHKGGPCKVTQYNII